MTHDEFNCQLNRLVKTFGKNAYSEERAILLWAEVADLDATWLARTVDRFIGECRQAPLMPEFRIAISKERERLWNIEKQRNSRDAKEFMTTTFDGPIIQSMCSNIRDRIMGKMADQEYKDFTNSIYKLGEKECSLCGNSGYQFVTNKEGYEWTYRCNCTVGAKKPRGIPLAPIQARQSE